MVYIVLNLNKNKADPNGYTGEKGCTMAKQKVFVICNPRAFFILGAWLPGWYAGEDDDGKVKFSAHDGVKVFTSKREANRVIKNLLPGCYIVEGSRDEV